MGELDARGFDARPRVSIATAGRAGMHGISAFILTQLTRKPERPNGLGCRFLASGLPEDGPWVRKMEVRAMPNE